MTSYKATRAFHILINLLLICIGYLLLNMGILGILPPFMMMMGVIFAMANALLFFFNYDEDESLTNRPVGEFFKKTAQGLANGLLHRTKRKHK